ncbi:MAG: site-specific integrase [Micromonosporaceae bacterium]|nr:site-specific integrase [Micromonosporaceae bacterium]
MRRPTITQGADGMWHAWISTGQTRAGGRTRQRHIKRRTRSEVEQELDRLLEQKRSGAPPRPGRAKTVEQWLTTWLDTVAPRRCDPTTIYDYRSKLRKWVYPVIGAVRLDQLTADHLDAVYLGMQRAGRAESTVVKVHRILSRALKVAWQRGHMSRDVARLLEDPPAVREVEMQALTEDEALRILETATGRRHAARWALALTLGLRQGEALGLRWEYVNLDLGQLRVWWQLRRRAYEHGCDRDQPCGRRRGGDCPARVLPMRPGEIQVKGALILKPPKSQRSRRLVPLAPEHVAMLRAQREIQALERSMAGPAYEDHDLVFAQPDGSPIDPSADHAEWQEILVAAGVRKVRVHDARHTAATHMRMDDVPVEIVQELLGHTDVRITRRYTHLAGQLARRAVNERAGKLLRRD